MSYADAQDYFFTEAMTFARGLLNPSTIPSAISTALAGLEAYATAPGQQLNERIRGVLASYRAHHTSRKALAQAVLLDALAWVCEELGSAYVAGGVVTNPSGAFFDFRKRMVADNEYINPRNAVPAADPAAGNGLLLRRLTVDHTGQAIEGGKHGETVTAEVVLNPLLGAGVGTAQVVLKGEDGPEDELDYQNKGTSRAHDVTLTLVGDSNVGAVPNSVFNVSGAPTAGTTVDSTNLADWTRTDVAGTATVTYQTSSPWRNRSGYLQIGGLNTTIRYSQLLVLPQGATPYTPSSPLLVVRPDANWTGSVKLKQGDTEQTWAHGALTAGQFNYLQLDLDSDLYPVNYDDGAPVIHVEINTTHATGKIDLFFLDVQLMTPRQGWWHEAWNHTADPIAGATKTWADSCTYAGETHDTIQAAFDEAPWAYLPSSGVTLITSVDV